MGYGMRHIVDKIEQGVQEGVQKVVFHQLNT